MSNILKGGESCHNVTGIFYACCFHTAVPNPRDGVCNAPTALEVLDSGTGGTVSFLPNLIERFYEKVNNLIFKYRKYRFQVSFLIKERGVFYA